MDWHPYKNFGHRQMCIEGRQCEETPRKDAIYEPRTDPGVILSSQLSEGTNFADSLISKIECPEQRQYISVVEPTQFVVLCYSNPGKQIHLTSSPPRLTRSGPRRAYLDWSQFCFGLDSTAE